MEEHLREHLLKMLDGEQAHVGFGKAVDGIGVEDAGRTVKGIPYTAWQIIEHMRLSQYDIIEFAGILPTRSQTGQTTTGHERRFHPNPDRGKEVWRSSARISSHSENSLRIPIWTFLP